LSRTIRSHTYFFPMATYINLSNNLDIK